MVSSSVPVGPTFVVCQARKDRDVILDPLQRLEN